MAIGMIAVVMMVSRLRVMWRRDRPCRTAVSPRKCVVISCLASRVVAADDREEDLLEGRLLLDVLDLGGREQLLELGEGAVHDDPALVEDRDPVGELLGLVQVLRREQHRRAAAGELLDRLPHLDARLAGRARSSARRGRSPAGSRSGSSRCRAGGACHRSTSPPSASAASVSEKRRSRSSAIVPGSLRCRSRATSTRFSRPVRISSTAANCPVRLIDSRTSRRPASRRRSR